MQERGVRIQILTPGRHSDQLLTRRASRRLYGSLLRAGAEIFEYQPSMMHAKTMVIDDDLALVGSINLDPLSLFRLEDGALVVRDRSFTQALAASFEEDIGHAEPIEP